LLWRDVTEGSQAANEEWDWIEVKEIYLVIFISSFAAVGHGPQFSSTGASPGGRLGFLTR